MKKIILSCLICLLVVSPSLAQVRTLPSSETEEFFQDAMSKINVRHVSWVKSIAKEANGRNLSIDDIRNKAGDYTSSQGLSEREMEFLIGLAGRLMAGDSREHLAQIKNSLAELKKQKDKLMKAIARLQNKRQPVTVVQLDSFNLLSQQSRALLNQVNSNKSEPVRLVSRDTIRVVKAGRLGQQVTQAAIDDQVFQLKQDLDSMSEMGEMESLRLQMAMDRLSKMMSTLSYLFKKISNTSNAIIQNLK